MVCELVLVFRELADHEEGRHSVRLRICPASAEHSARVESREERVGVD